MVALPAGLDREGLGQETFAYVAWLSLALEYTGREWWVSARYLLLGSIIPLTTLLLVWTEQAHDLVWREVGLDTYGPVSVLLMHYGP